MRAAVLYVASKTNNSITSRPMLSVLNGSRCRVKYHMYTILFAPHIYEVQSYVESPKVREPPENPVSNHRSRPLVSLSPAYQRCSEITSLRGRTAREM